MAFMNAVPDDVAEQAAAIQASFSQSVAAVASNGELTTEARQMRLARVYVAAAAEMTKLREGFESKEVKTADDLNVDLFGSVSSLGADAISARDADDRAAQLANPDEARALLDRAEKNGDQVLARSIAMRAFTASRNPLLGGSMWAAVLDAYASRRPEVAAKMAELAEAQQRSAAKSFGRAMIFILPKPHELNRMSDYQIRATAEKQLPSTPPPKRPAPFAGLRSDDPAEVFRQALGYQ